jgi:hypothetical protein
MNSERYFQEICRRVKPYNIETEGLKENGSMYFSYDGEPLCRVAPDGARYHFPEHLNTEEKKELCSLVTEIAEETRVYIQAMGNAPPFQAADLRDGYKLLGEYGNVVLAGKDMREYGFEFVTWKYTYDRKGVTLGHYYHNDYEGAKEDFAVRSGLVNEHKLFKDKELQAIYRTLEQGRSYIPFLAFDQEKEILNIQDRIKEISPKAVEAFKGEQAAQLEKPVFLVRLMAGDIENDLLKVQRDSEGDLLVHELMLPATDEELQAAYDFGAKNETCYQTIQGIRYPIPVGDMAAADLNSLNESAKMIDRMSEMEIADLWISLRAYYLEYEYELKGICEEVLRPLTIMQNNLTM